jgi:hypothetical protein
VNSSPAQHLLHPSRFRHCNVCLCPLGGAPHRGRTGQDAISFVTPEDQELVAQAISNCIPSLIAGHLADVSARDERTVKPWFTGKLDYSPPVVELSEAGYTLIGDRIGYAGPVSRRSDFVPA